MIVFIDYEHADGHKAEYGERVLAARTWITYRLEDLAGMHCMLVRYHSLTWDLLKRLDAKAIFISGNSIDPEHYDPATTATLKDVLNNSGLPVFGFCGGWQVLASSLGADVVPLTITESEVKADDRLITLPSGRPFEYGYHPVELNGGHALLDGIDADPIVRHAHGLHVPTTSMPDGFRTVAANSITPVQMAVNDERKMAGTQFHPEYWTDDHPEGRTMIANFLRWSGVTG